MPTIGFILINGLKDVSLHPTIPIESQTNVVLYVVLPFTVVLPLGYLAMLRISRAVKSIELKSKHERIPLFIGTLIFYLFAYVIVRVNVGRLPEIYYSMMLGGILSVFISTVITFKWKISVHAVGIFGLAGLLFATGELIRYSPMYVSSPYYLGVGESPVFWPIVNVTLLAGAVASSRLVLGAHTPAQIYAGAAVGFCSLYFPVKFLLFI